MADYAELEKALVLAQQSEETTKLIKMLEKGLDEKSRERYATLTDEEIMWSTESGTMRLAPVSQPCILPYPTGLPTGSLSFLGAMKKRFRPCCGKPTSMRQG